MTLDQNPSYEDLLTTVQFLMNDNKALKQRVSLAVKMIPEIFDQGRYASASRPAVPRLAVKPSTWIAGPWLAPSVDVLLPAEKLWQGGNANGALECVDSVLCRHDLTTSEDVHANLMVSAIKRASGDLAQASKCAEDALVIARDAGDHMLASKAQFYRAFCFFSQERYMQAKFCFALASHLDGYQELIGVNSLLVDELCRKLPLDHPEDRFPLSPDTPVSGTALSEANAAGLASSLPGSILTAKPHNSERSFQHRSYRGTAYPRPSYSPSSFSENSPLAQPSDVADEEPTSAPTPTFPSPNPPKAPAYEFGPPALEVANPDNDPDLSDAIFVPTGADQQPNGSHQIMGGHTTHAECVEYREQVAKQERRLVANEMQKRESLQRQHEQQRAAWQDERERARVAANRWFRPVGVEARKPNLISDQEVDEEARQIGSNGNTKVTQEDIPAAESERHPPLYNNFPDQLRQMAVELLLQRAKIAYTLKDWKTMDSTSRQAKNLATHFKCKPYVARSAFWVGIALYHQKNWTAAYEEFDEADKTDGYYIARRYIGHWLKKTAGRLEGTTCSAGPSAIRGEYPPILTPLLDTVVEEADHYPFQDLGDQNGADEARTPTNNMLSADGRSIHALMTALQADDSDRPRQAGHNTQSWVTAASPKDPIPRVKPRPKAITLPSIVEPPRVRTPRLYEPQASGTLSVAGADELSPRETGQAESASTTAETSVDANQEDELESEENHPAHPLEHAAFSEAPSEQDYAQSLAFLSQQAPPLTISIPSSPLSSPTPTTAVPISPHVLRTPTASLPPISLEQQQRRSVLAAQRRLEDGEIDAEIRNVKAAASPRIASARSASSRYSAQALWLKPLVGGNEARGVERQIGRSQSVRSAGRGGGALRGGQRPGPMTRASESAVMTMGGIPIRSRERRSRFDGLEGWSGGRGEQGKN
ncbi:MAG: hypothetical protein Q9169_003481 [Polycauliona sp. 2 TL-2023]